MSFGQLIMILRARARLIMSIALATLAAAALVTLLWPARYDANASVVIDPKGDGSVLGTTMMLPAVENLVSTHRDIMGSPNVALKVIDLLRLDQKPEAKRLLSVDGPLSGIRGSINWALNLFSSSEEESPESVKDWMATQLLQNVSLSTNRDSRLIKVTYSSPDPAFSAAVANAFVQAYRDTLLQLQVGPAKQTSQWFEEQLKELKRNVEQAEGKVSKFQQERGIVATDERLDLESARLQELSSQLVEAQSQAYDSSARQQQLQDYIAKGGAQAPNDVLISPMVQQRQMELAQREAKLSELSTRLGKNHPEFQGAEQEVQRARARVREEMRIAAQGLSGNSSVAQHRESSLRKSLQEQRTKVLGLRKERVELATLMQEADNARHAYEAAAQRYSQTRLEGQVAQTSVSSVVDSASVPTKPAFPKTKLNLMVGLVLGLALGVAVALFLETVHRYVRSEMDITEMLGVPVLAVLAPKLGARPNVLRLTHSNVYKLEN